MCQPSNKLTLCSCDFENGFPDHYWILHRYVGQKEMYVIGDAILPFFNWEQHQLNEQEILQALNTAPCFDVPVQLKKGDVLYLSFKNEESFDSYTFRYTGEKWAVEEFGPFELTNQYDKIKTGLIQSNINNFL